MTDRRFRFGFTAAAILLIAAGALWLHLSDFSPDRSRFPIRGIDVSHHQGAIDWSRVARNDVRFAYVKATEGGDWIDTRVEENLREARAAGLTVGAYHFFTFCRPGDEQARNFLSVIPSGVEMLPPVVDMEYEGNCSANPSPEEFATELTKFLEIVETAFGGEVIYYSPLDFRMTYLGKSPKRRIWERLLGIEPQSDWVIWQYHDRGDVDGIEGPVDLNVLAGDTMLGPMLSKRDNAAAGDN